ncbi:MAG: phospholipase D family protein [Alphaproteobacteria bacterium]|nr:phospholipase D family protein [Alphaproteobacteria bacterium]
MRKKPTPWVWMGLVAGIGLALSLTLGGQTLHPPKSVPALAASPSSSGSIPGVQVLYLGFTPPTGVANQIVQAIDQARTEVLVQAYGFTHNAIAQAVIRAHERGVKTRVLLDEKSQGTNKYVIGLFNGAGVSMRQDGAHAIAHNKVIVIDQQVVITGSFNFTNSAETRNAENVLILKSDELSHSYRQNWQTHWDHSRP